MPGAHLTRRMAIRAGLRASASFAVVGLPTWGRIWDRRRLLRAPDSLPRPWQSIGTPVMPQIEHVVVLMMENHSFDNILGMLPWQVRARRDVDGFPAVNGRPYAVNLDRGGNPVPIFHLPDLCPSTYLSQEWSDSHLSWDHGRNDGFVRAVGGETPMGYFDQSDLPFSYGLATHFPISDRYFCSLLGQTDPNRRYLFAGTSSGEVDDTDEESVDGKPPGALTLYAKNGTIFDRLDAAGIEWLGYYQNVPSELLLPNVNQNKAQVAKLRPYSEFLTAAKRGTLPSFTMLDPDYTVVSEENPQDVAYGENFVAEVVGALASSPQWMKTILFINYDEHGGYYDHVPPPRAIPPDNIPPAIPPGGQPGGFNRYGFRVPLYVVSPWARPRYVSHQVADHTSILAFIENKWNLPALTWRDANAWDLTDMLRLHRPAFADVPELPAPPNIQATLDRCHADGEHPPTAEAAVSDG